MQVATGRPLVSGSRQASGHRQAIGEWEQTGKWPQAGHWSVRADRQVATGRPFSGTCICIPSYLPRTIAPTRFRLPVASAVNAVLAMHCSSILSMCQHHLNIFSHYMLTVPALPFSSYAHTISTLLHTTR